MSFFRRNLLRRRPCCGDPPSRQPANRRQGPSLLIFAKNLVLFVEVSKDTMALVRAKRKPRQQLWFRRRPPLPPRSPQSTLQCGMGAVP